MTDEDLEVIRSIEGTIKTSSDLSLPSRLIMFQAAMHSLLSEEHKPGFTDAWSIYSVPDWYSTIGNSSFSYRAVALASLHYAYNHGVSAATLNMLAATHLS